MADPIHIALISDAAYAGPLRTTIASVLSAANPGDALFFHIVDCGLGETNKRGIAALKAIHPFACRYVTPDPAAVAGLPAHRCAPCAYYKAKLPELLPEIDKLIYLDSDLLVLASLRELWETPLDGAPLAAARDFIDYVKEELHNFQHLTGFGFNPHRSYFNSGVLLLDLAQLRAEGFSEAFSRARRDLGGKIRFSDQDVLNYLFQDRVHILSQAWNVQTTLFLLQDGRIDWETTGTAIVHYTTEAKPWIDGTICFLREEYVRLDQLAGKLAASSQ